MITRSKAKLLKRENRELVPVTKRQRKKKKVVATDNIKIEPLELLIKAGEEIKQSDAIIYGIDWEPILRKTYKDPQYEIALETWRYILLESGICKRVDGVEEIHLNGTGSPIMVLSQSKLQQKATLNLITDITDVYLQPSIGYLERPVTYYLSLTNAHAMDELRMVGWYNPPNPCTGMYL